MQASEAIAILEALDPSHEVTLDIGVHKMPTPKTRGPAYTYLPGQTPPLWHTGGFWTPYKNEITCKLH